MKTFWCIRNKKKDWYTGRDENKVPIYGGKFNAVPFTLDTAKEIAKELVEQGYEVLDIYPL